MSKKLCRYFGNESYWTWIQNRLAFMAIIAMILCILIVLWNWGFAAQVSDETKHQEKVKNILWESIQTNKEILVLRTKVPGGWFIVIKDHRVMLNKQDLGGAFFYTDPDYKWDDISSPK